MLLPDPMPEATNLAKLPQSPFNFWGFYQKVRDFGIKESSPKEELWGTLFPTLQTSQPLLAMAELVNKDLGAALSKELPQALPCPGLLPALGVCEGFKRHHIQERGQFPHSLFGTHQPERALPLGAEPGLREWDQLQEPWTVQPWPFCPHCHLPHVPSIEVATSSIKDNAIKCQLHLERHLSHHLRSKVSVSVVLPHLGI